MQIPVKSMVKNMDMQDNEKVEENVELKRNSSEKIKIKKELMAAKILKLKELLQLPEFQLVLSDAGVLLPPSSQIFKRISNAMNPENRMSPKYIYLVLKSNRYSIYSDLLCLLNIKAPIEESVDSDSTVNSSPNTETFDLDVCRIWSSMEPETTLHKFSNRDRIIRSLRKNSWTHVLFEEIHNHTNLPCALTFKRSQVSESGIYVTIKGKCTECSCEFDGRILQEPTEGDKVIMECRIENFDPAIEHKKKRPLHGKLRTAVANEMIKSNLLPSQHRRNEAHRLIKSVGDTSPPHLPTNEVLRKAKQEGINRELGITSCKVMDSLCTLKFTEKYEGSIHNIGLDPPVVHYFTREQILLFENFPEEIKIDATGSAIKSIILPNGETCSHIYLFQAVAIINGRTIPVFQMISASQTTVTIMHWFLEFIRIGTAGNPKFPLPREVVTDFDKALLGASVRVFAQSTSLKNYLSQCFDLIQGTSTKFPSCIVRLDVCHYTQIIARWKCYSKHQPGVRTFYLRAMCFLRKQEDFHEFEKILVAILTVSLCENGNRGSFAFKAREFIKNKIKGIKDTDIEDVINDPEKFEKLEMKIEPIETEHIQNTNLGEWVDNTFKKVKELTKNEIMTEEDDVNGYRLPDFAQKVKGLMPYFPIFTEVMRKLRGCGTVNATSAAVESEFNDLKHRTFRTYGLPLRADKFIAIHLLAIPKKLKEAASGSLTITKHGEVEAILKKTKALNKREKQKRKNEENLAAMEEDNLNIENKCHNKNKKFCEMVKFEEDNETKTTKTTNEDNETKTTKTTNEEEELTVMEIKEELNIEHNWRNKNKKKREMEVEYPVGSSESDEESDNDTLPDVSNFKQLQLIKKKESPKRKRARYSDPCPQFEPSLHKHTWLPILQNGLKCKNIREITSTTVVLNTCAFDSIGQIISMTIINNEFYSQQVEGEECDIFSWAKLFIKNKICAEIYKKRATILQNSGVVSVEVTQQKRWRDNQTKSIIKIDGACNLIELALSLFSTAPSYTVDITCSVCGSSKTKVRVVVNTNSKRIKTNGIKDLQEALDVDEVNKTRNCCGQNRRVNVNYGPHLLIDVQLGFPKLTKFSDIPPYIIVDQQRRYRISGLVAYQGGYEPNTVGHYVGYACVETKWLKYDDTSSSKTPDLMNDHEIQIDPHLLFYTLY